TRFLQETGFLVPSSATTGKGCTGLGGHFMLRGGGTRMRWMAGGLLLLGLMTAGCGKPTGTVSGKVSYRGRPLPAGTVMFLAEDDGVASGPIQADGTFKIGNVPVGTNKVTVATERPVPPVPRPKDMHPPPDVPPPEQPPVPAGKYVPIPDKYRNPNESGLTC